MDDKQDIIISCSAKGCTEKRTFTVRDQEFYARKGFTPPKYCKTHSAERKAAHQARENNSQQEQRDNWDPRGAESDASQFNA